MKTRNRILCLLLALLLCLSFVFVACNNEPDDPTPPVTDDGGNTDGDGDGDGDGTQTPVEPQDPTDQKKGELHETGYTGEGAQVQEPNEEVGDDDTLRS